MKTKQNRAPNKPTFKLSDMDIRYKRTFLSSEGKQVLEDLKKVCRYGQTIFQPGKSDRDNAFEQGRQSVINEILFILNKEAK